MEVESEEEKIDLSNVPAELKEKLLTINAQIEKYNELLKCHEMKLQSWKVYIYFLSFILILIHTHTKHTHTHTH
jgi:hypothetical protein